MTSVVGVGGGVIMVPLLPHFQAMTGQEAVATSLFTILCVTLRNTFGFHRRGLIPWRATAPLLLGAAIFSLATGWFSSGASELALKLFFGISLLFVLVFVFKKEKVIEARGPVALAQLKSGLVGAVCGILSAGSGLGAGLVAGPLLQKLKVSRSEEVIPMVNVMMIVNSAMGSLGYLIGNSHWENGKWGSIWVQIALYLFVGSQLASPIGIKYQQKMPPHWRLRLLLALLLIVLSHVWWDIVKLWIANNSFKRL